jgi:hypothetical protein
MILRDDLDSRCSPSGRNASTQQGATAQVVFYMSFHSEDRAKYVKSGQCLSNKTLESVAEYYENIFSLQVADGSLAKKHERQIEQCVRCKMHHQLCKWYDEKVRRVTEQHHGGDGRHSRQVNKYYRNDYKWQDCNDSGCRNNYNKCEKKQEDRTPPDCGDNAFKPCSIHRPKSKHTIKECYKNPKNRKRQVPDKKLNTRRITTMRATQATMMSRALALIHWS